MPGCTQRCRVTARVACLTQWVWRVCRPCAAAVADLHLHLQTPRTRSAWCAASRATRSPTQTASTPWPWTGRPPRFNVRGGPLQGRGGGPTKRVQRQHQALAAPPPTPAAPSPACSVCGWQGGGHLCAARRRPRERVVDRGGGRAAKCAFQRPLLHHPVRTAVSWPRPALARAPRRAHHLQPQNAPPAPPPPALPAPHPPRAVPCPTCSNLAVGGLWPDPPDATTPFPATYTVDYVRVWGKPA